MAQHLVIDPGSDPTWIVELDPELDPFATPDGVTLAVKDCIDVEGVVTSAGSPMVADGALPALADAACLAGARLAGARIVGKTNLHELCFGSTGVNPHYGTPVNPIDPRRVPGGSSSGSAVAVATGRAQVAYGTDTAGSVRNPAACCGVVGLKTTWGTVPVAGVRPLAPSLDTVGVLARTVADLAIGATMLDERLTAGDLWVAGRVGRLRFPGTEPTIDAAVDSALIDAGFVVEDVELPGWAAAREATETILFGEALLVNDEPWHHFRSALGADVVARFSKSERISLAQLSEARDQRNVWRAELAYVLATVDLLAMPTMLAYPARLDDRAPGPNPAASPLNLAGHPAIAVPIPSGGLLPASLQLVGADHSEPGLIGTAAAVEAAVR